MSARAITADEFECENIRALGGSFSTAGKIKGRFSKVLVWALVFSSKFWLVSLFDLVIGS